ncbi:hypothetical protein ACA910_013198 [Epithemia clementina (nom. ined.)]
MEVLRNLFADKLIEDDREPLWIFSIPGLDGDYALYAPRSQLWNQLIFVILMQLFFQTIFAVIVYLTIIKRRGTTTSYLIGYGLVIPLAMYIPFEMLEFFKVYNCTIKLAFATLPTIVCFRTIEAMHGTSPPVVESSVGTYIVYYSTVTHFEWDAKTKTRRKITSGEILSSLLRITYFFTAVSLWLSFMVHVNFQPMPSSIALNSFHLSWDLLSRSHLINAYCLAVLTYFVLATGFELTVFGEQLKGFATKSVFDNPLFSSRSIREFWGKKWDVMIQRVLKHGAFLPAKKAFADSGANISYAMGLFAAFLASGLLHEYSWAAIFYEYGEEEGKAVSTVGSYSPKPLKLTAFFLYNALTMLIEHYYGRHITFFEKWPSFVVSTILVLTALPVSHWFTGDWAVGGYFSDFAIGLWHIRKIQTA